MTDMNIKQIWMGARTTRYHTDPHLTGKQNNADHQWGVSVIVLSLYEAYRQQPSVNVLKAALTHDSAEFLVGDFPNPFKQKYPEFKKAHNDIETAELVELGVDVPLTKTEQDMLKLADSLEAIVFCSLHRPDYRLRPDWISHVDKTLGKAEDISHSVYERARSIISMVDMLDYKTGVAA